MPFNVLREFSPKPFIFAYKTKAMSLSPDFIKSIQSLLGDETGAFLSANAEDAPVSIRLNPAKFHRNPMTFSDPVERVLWSDWGYYLNNRPAFTFDPLFHSGYYYVQEAASMFIEYVVRQLVRQPVTCLDLCAAPGGKSLGLMSALPEGSLLVSNEIVRSRANVLAETLAKFGNPYTVVTGNAPKDLSAFPHLFDVMLADAPCSGEGMFRKDETAVREWSPANVQMCVSRQRDIVSDAWKALKPGGLFIYSTCTYNMAEDEENALWMARELGATFVAVTVDKTWGISPSAHREAVAYRFFPHKTKGEGLFVAVLQKTSGENYASAGKNKKKPAPFLKEISEYGSFLQHPENFRFLQEHNRIVAVPEPYADRILSLRDALNVLSCGIEIGERKGKDLIPSTSLALSTELNSDAFMRYEVSYDDAVAYLRSESLALSDVPKGQVLLTYKHEPLGFVKNIGPRANNLYPNEWRIRSGYLPENKPDFLRETK